MNEFKRGLTRHSSMSRLYKVVAIGLVWAGLCPAAHADQISLSAVGTEGIGAPDIGTKLFDQLIAQLGSNKFIEREEASVALIGFATRTGRPGGLTGAQLLKIQQIGDGVAEESKNPEVRMRAGRVFQEFINGVPAGSAIRDAIGVRLLNSKGDFSFGGLEGKFVNDMGKQDLVKLQQKWLEIQLGVNAGDVPSAQKAYDALLGFVRELNRNNGKRLKDLNLDPDKVFKALLDAENQLQELPGQLQKKGANPNLPLKDSAIVRAPGRVDLGKSFALRVGGVGSPGALDFSDLDAENETSLPPAGFQYVGHIYNLEADNGLLVSGTIDVAIEYGAVQLIGNPVRDPRLLQLVRIADGQDYFLSNAFNDLSTHVISASYVPSPSDGPDQFGEFAVVQPSPEPPSLLLLGSGLIALVGFARKGRASWSTPWS